MAQICTGPSATPAEAEHFPHVPDHAPGRIDGAPLQFVWAVQLVEGIRAEVDRVGFFIVQHAKFQAAQFPWQMFRQPNMTGAVDQIGLLFVGGTGRLYNEDRDLALDQSRKHLEDDRFEIRREGIERAIHHPSFVGHRIESSCVAAINWAYVIFPSYSSPI